VIDRWIDDLDACDRLMDGRPPLSNQQADKVTKFGPWLHRFLVFGTILITILFQEQIVEIFHSIGIENNVIILSIELISIISLWGIIHKILRLS
jgi:hypothetical protein